MFETLSQTSVHCDVGGAPVRVGADAVHNGLNRLSLQRKDLVERPKFQGVLWEPVLSIFLWRYLEKSSESSGSCYWTEVEKQKSELYFLGLRWDTCRNPWYDVKKNYLSLKKHSREHCGCMGVSLRYWVFVQTKFYVYFLTNVNSCYAQGLHSYLRSLYKSSNSFQLENSNINFVRKTQLQCLFGLQLFSLNLLFRFKT